MQRVPRTGCLQNVVSVASSSSTKPASCWHRPRASPVSVAPPRRRSTWCLKRGIKSRPGAAAMVLAIFSAISCFLVDRAALVIHREPRQTKLRIRGGSRTDPCYPRFMYRLATPILEQPVEGGEPILLPLEPVSCTTSSIHLRGSSN